MRPWALPALLLVALTGCFDLGPCFDTPSVATVPADAPAEAGSGEHALAIRVTGLGAAGAVPVAGAAIVAVFAVPVDQGVDQGEEAALRSVARGDRASSEERFILVFADLRSGPDGVAHLRVPSNAMVQLAAAARDWTTEHTDILGRGQPLPTEHTLVLYPTSVTLAAAGNLAPGASTPAAPTPGPEHEFTWPSDHVAMQARLRSLQARLTWENTATSMSDLAVTVGGGETGFAFGDTGSNEFGRTGPQEVLASGDADDDWGTWEAVAVGIGQPTATRVDATEYTVELTGQFTGQGDLDEVCVPDEFVVHGPMDLASFETGLRKGAREAGPSGAFAWLALAVAVAVVLARRTP